jgi:hypothetical protein
MAMGTIADDVEPGHEQASRRAARRSVGRCSGLRSSRVRTIADCYSWSAMQAPGTNTPGRGSRQPAALSLAGQAEAAGLVIGLDDYPIWRILTAPPSAATRPCSPLPATAAAAANANRRSVWTSTSPRC